MKKNVVLVFILVLNLIFLSCSTDEEDNATPSKYFFKRYGGDSEDEGFSLQQTEDGGFIITGITYSSSTKSRDLWLLKTDSLGSILFDKTIGGTSSDWGMSIIKNENKGYFIAGHTSSYGAGSYDYLLVKTDLLGNVEWKKTYGGPDMDWNYRECTFQQTNDKGFIFVGSSESYSSGSFDIWVIKTDSLGLFQWDNKFGGETREDGWSVVQTNDDGYIITGGQGGAWLIKLDSQGNEVWNKKIDVSFASNQIIKDIDYGYLLLAGNSLIKVDNAGEEKWRKTIEIDGFAIEKTLPDGFIITGWINKEVALMKLDSEKEIEWQKSYEIDGGWPRSVKQTYDYGYAVTGKVDIGSNYNDLFLLRTDENGNIDE
ncbi:MAG TPA: hypothetical protein PLK90_08180 [Clostridiales bacterium]|nr:hypothetical protein [Clostridiales bacterium]HQP70361.1 hypothetical protein [Clostridiales bacterium]